MTAECRMYIAVHTRSCALVKQIRNPSGRHPEVMQKSSRWVPEVPISTIRTSESVPDILRNESGTNPSTGGHFAGMLDFSWRRIIRKLDHIRHPSGKDPDVRISGSLTEFIRSTYPKITLCIFKMLAPVLTQDVAVKCIYIRMFTSVAVYAEIPLNSRNEIKSVPK